MIDFKRARTVDRDVKLLWASVFIRMASYGMTNQVLTLFMKEVGINEGAIGLFMTLTLAGDTVISFFLTVWSNEIGRRRIIMLGAVMMIASGLVFMKSVNFYMLLAAAVVGVISPSGDETGPFKSVEEASLAHIVTADLRPMVFALHGVLSAAGGAVGSLASGLLVDHLQLHLKWDVLECYRLIFGIYSLLACCKLVISFFMSEKCEANYGQRAGQTEESACFIRNNDYNSTTEDLNENLIASESIARIHDPAQSSKGSVADRNTIEEDDCDTLTQAKSHMGLSAYSFHHLSRLLVVFFFDSLGYGFMPSGWVVYYIRTSFQVPAKAPGVLFFINNLVSSASSLPAAYLSTHFGPVAVMFFSQAPSSVFFMLIAFFKSFYVVAFLLILFYSTSTMDVVPRQVLLSSLFPNEELAIVMGFVNITKTFARCIGPIFTGQLSAHHGLRWGFVINGACTLVADFILVTNFLELDRDILMATATKGEQSSNEL